MSKKQNQVKDTSSSEMTYMLPASAIILITRENSRFDLLIWSGQLWKGRFQNVGDKGRHNTEESARGQ
ncbi:MAG: hypothetical protein ACYDIC_05545 [Desulfobaccales bacterium]